MQSSYKKKVVCFDLDDTLYKEIYYLFSGFRKVAEAIEQRTGARDVFRHMCQLRQDGENVFETLEKECGGVVDKAEMLKIYREHKPAISLADGTEELLDSLKEKGCILGLITDGRSVSQRNKIEALGLYRWFKNEDILISEEFGCEKPDERLYRYYENRYPGCQYYYVGDNAVKDFVTPNRMGWETYGVRDIAGENIHTNDMDNGEQEYKPMYTIDNIRSLEEKLFTPIVSIIIPVYQVSDYVERCLRSVISQTYKAIECIIVDDAGKDDSIEKCERLIASYNGPIQFKIVHHQENRGVSAARNTGTSSATGEYLFYLDSDDIITSDCIEKLMSYVIKDNSIQMVQGQSVLVDNGHERKGNSAQVRVLSNDEARRQYLYWRHINYCIVNKLLSRSFIIDNNIVNREGLVNEDLLWTFYLIKHLSNAQLCEDVTYYYLTRENSIITGTKKPVLGLSYANVFNDILNNLTPGKEKEELLGYQTTFCVVLSGYLRMVPELLPVLKFYKKQSVRYRAWAAYVTVSVTAFVSRFFNPARLLGWLNNLRNKLKIR